MDGAKDYFYINDVDDREYLTLLIKATIPALQKLKAKSRSIAFSLGFIIFLFDIHLGFIGIMRVFPLGFIKNDYICH